MICSGRKIDAQRTVRIVNNIIGLIKRPFLVVVMVVRNATDPLKMRIVMEGRRFLLYKLRLSNVM